MSIQSAGRLPTAPDARIMELEKLRDELTGCIGCGCLSLRTCRLINRADVAAADCTGSYLQSDRG